MPETVKEASSCHQCGLEAIDDCESQNIHIPADESSVPCAFCVRNRDSKERVADFYTETWTRDSDKTAIIEDPDPHERILLEILHNITIREVKNIAD